MRSFAGVEDSPSFERGAVVRLVGLPFFPTAASFALPARPVLAISLAIQHPAAGDGDVVLFEETFGGPRGAVLFFGQPRGLTGHDLPAVRS